MSILEKEAKVFRVSKKELERLKKSKGQIRKKVASELKPFLDFVRNMDKESREFKSFMQVQRDFVYSMKNVMAVFEYLVKDLLNLSEGIKRGEISKLKARDIIYLLFLYFGITESIGNRITDYLVMLLVANGRHFHIERIYGTPKIKHAESLDELEKERVSLTTKLNFLKEGGISESVSAIDSELRNAIAHLKISVKEDMIYIKGKPAVKVSIFGSVNLLWAVSAINKEVIQLTEDLSFLFK